MWQSGERREPLVQHAAHTGAALYQPVPFQVAHGGESRGAGDRVVRERLGVHEAPPPGALRDRVHDALRRRNGRQRRVAPRNPLAQRHDVGRDVVRCDRPPRPRPTRPAQDFVRNEEDVVAVADLPHASEVVGPRRGGAGRRTAHRLRDERGDVLGAEARDRFLEDVAAARGAAGVLTAARATVGIRRRDAVHIHQPRAEHRLVLLPRGRRQREQRAPVVARRERDDLVLAGPLPLHPILSRQLQRRLDRLRTAREEVELRDVTGQRRGELGGELLGGAVGEHGAREIPELPGLLGDGVGDLGVGVAQVGHIGAPDGVQVALAALVHEPAALAAHDARVHMPELPVEDVAVWVGVGHETKATMRGGTERARARVAVARGPCSSLTSSAADYWPLVQGQDTRLWIWESWFESKGANLRNVRVSGGRSPSP